MSRKLRYGRKKLVGSSPGRRWMKPQSRRQPRQLRRTPRRLPTIAGRGLLARKGGAGREGGEQVARRRMQGDSIMAKTQIALKVNGKAVEALVEPRTLLIHFLREQLNLTGPHVGCDTSHCGACTVDLNAKSVKSCTMF